MIRRVGVAVLTAATLAGCGGSSGPLSRTAFIAAVNSACRDNSKPGKGTGDDAASRFAALGAANKHWAAKLDSLRGPTDLVERAKAAAALIKQSEPLGDRFAADVKVAEQGNPAAVDAKRDAVLVRQADALTNRARSQLVAMGAQSCRATTSETTVIK
jgi:hypothetical protein